MTKGKHAGAANAVLRTKLAESEAARAKLERRVLEAERERDAAVAWRKVAQTEGLPAILAERARADAAVAHEYEAVQNERDRWELLVEQARPLIVRMIQSLDKTKPVFNFDAPDLHAFVELHGTAFGEGLGGSRNQRKNTASGASLVRFQNAMREAGLAP